MSLALRIALVVALALALALGRPLPASAVERVFAGTAQLDYHAIPSQPRVDARALSLDRITLEAAGKAVVDISDRVSVNVKLCYGCHGFELDMAHIDFRIDDQLAIRIGRFSPAFGNFMQRHDPADQTTIDRPLAYDHGRMLRARPWNLGVLPSPSPDNGVEISGVHGFRGRDRLCFDYAAHLVAGFKGAEDALDLDFLQSRSGPLYYKDNNAQPSVGGRIGASGRVGIVDGHLGVSAMYGAFDPSGRLSYSILGAHLTLRAKATSVRLEYLWRRQDFATRDAARLGDPLSNGDTAFGKHGAFLEVEQQLAPHLALVGRFDVMHRAGNRPADAPELARTSTVFRTTLATRLVIERGFALKWSTELWNWTDRDASSGYNDVSFRLAAIATF